MCKTRPAFLPTHCFVVPKHPTYHLAPVPAHQEIKISVDASAWGVGLVVNGYWQAWEFIPSSRLLPRHPHTNRIDNNWGEIIAAEMGIYATIRSGLYNATLVVRSDNQGVVSALKKHVQFPPTITISGHSPVKSKTPDLIKESVRRIHATCATRRIRLEPCWISGRQNPADAPSRGRLGGQLKLENRFWEGGEVPKHMKEILRPAVRLIAANV